MTDLRSSWQSSCWVYWNDAPNYCILKRYTLCLNQQVVISCTLFPFSYVLRTATEACRKI